MTPVEYLQNPLDPFPIMNFPPQPLRFVAVVSKFRYLHPAAGNNGQMIAAEQ